MRVYSSLTPPGSSIPGFLRGTPKPHLFLDSLLYGVCELTITVKPAEIEWEEKDIGRHLKKNEVLNVSAGNIENI